MNKIKESYEITKLKDQELFFKRLIAIKDNWIKSSVDSLCHNSDFIWSENEQEYVHLQGLLVKDDDKQAYKKVLDEVMKGDIHSILVMLDGGDELADNLSVDLINVDTNMSLKKGIALHEEFFSYLLDKEK